jgi:hypothetical protein
MYPVPVPTLAVLYRSGTTIKVGTEISEDVPVPVPYKMFIFLGKFVVEPSGHRRNSRYQYQTFAKNYFVFCKVIPVEISSSNIFEAVVGMFLLSDKSHNIGQ